MMIYEAKTKALISCAVTSQLVFLRTLLKSNLVGNLKDRFSYDEVERVSVMALLKKQKLQEIIH